MSSSVIQNRQGEFDKFRRDYPQFSFDSIDVAREQGSISVVYHFTTHSADASSDDINFTTSWSIPVENDCAGNLSASAKRLIFLLGVTEGLSYWKATCSPVFALSSELEAEFVFTENEVKFFSKLFFNGLGEFFYLNRVLTTPDDLVSFTSGNGSGHPTADRWQTSTTLSCTGETTPKVLVPVGGGKDSIVTLELLRQKAVEVIPFVINTRGATEDTIQVFTSNSSVNSRINNPESDNCALRATRRLDSKIVELNSKGFLNGHTPFSAVVAFSSTLTALLNNCQYVALSNESSANEATSVWNGVEVNHQYSKSLEFERDFQSLISAEDGLLKSNTTDNQSRLPEYFSFLRQFNELQIAREFARHPEYFPVFRSCNRGSKTNTWCCDCSKCLFVYTILAPFLDEAQLNAIFGEDLTKKPSLQVELHELLGETEAKPFECVGTVSEVRAALAAKNGNRQDLNQLLAEPPAENLIPKFLAS